MYVVSSVSKLSLTVFYQIDAMATETLACKVAIYISLYSNFSGYYGTIDVYQMGTLLWNETIMHRHKHSRGDLSQAHAVGQLTFQDTKF